jgi:hypothetical protein
MDQMLEALELLMDQQLEATRDARNAEAVVSAGRQDKNKPVNKYCRLRVLVSTSYSQLQRG